MFSRFAQAKDMFLRWAKEMFTHAPIRGLCKHFLKHLIVGEIDVSQLDLQPGAGTIQLRNLALNVDVINQKLGVSPGFIIKEGSIGSLLVKIPWKERNCQIEFEELELVLAPYWVGKPSVDDYEGTTREDIARGSETAVENLQSEIVHDNAGPSLVGDGVNKIFKRLEWLLTIFNIKVKKLFIVFDPSLKSDESRPEMQSSEKKMESTKVLVTRIAEIQFGTYFSEEDAEARSVLGPASVTRLTNFIKFQEAVVELLHIGSWPSGPTTPILAGNSGGFSGTVELMPWRNWSIEISIEPLLLRLQPSCIIWLLHIQECLRNVGVNGRNVLEKAVDSLLVSSRSCYHSFSEGNSISSGKVAGNTDKFNSVLSLATNQQAGAHNLIPGTCVIPDWVPLFDNTETGGEPDFAASMEQFFECIDEMRNSQAAMDDDGIWNWTCSVFNAITSASNVLSESVPISSVEQKLGTKLHATVPEVCLVLSFDDEPQTVHYLEANFRDLTLVMEISPKKKKVEAVMGHFKVDHCFNNENKSMDCGTLTIPQWQAAVLSDLPSFNLPIDGAYSEEATSGFCLGDMVRVPLLTSVGDSCCQIKVSSTYLDGISAAATSFSVELPPFVFWMNFYLVAIFSDLLKKVRESTQEGNDQGFGSEIFVENDGSRFCGVLTGRSCDSATVSSSDGHVQGSISMSDTRIILCFSSENEQDLRLCSSFIGFDFSSSLTLGVKEIGPRSNASSLPGSSCDTSNMIGLHFGDLKSYLITSNRNFGKLFFSAKNFFSVKGKCDGYDSSISMSWQEGTVTGPWIARKTWGLVTSQNSRNRNKVTEDGYEFTSVKTLEDLKEQDSYVQQEIILSSGFVLHVRVHLVWICLGSSEFKSLYHLSNRVLNNLTKESHSLGASGGNSIQTMPSTSHGHLPQTSILVECNVLDLSINVDHEECADNSMQKELPGFWNRLHLTAKKFEFLSVLNLGGIDSATFVWVRHDEGELWGSLAEPSSPQDVLLISCSNSAARRGDGEGHNTMSLGSAGTVIFYVTNPQSLESVLTIVVKCATIVAPGGRLDWVKEICSFFDLPSAESRQMGLCDMKEHSFDDSFFLDLVDTALSYELPFENLSNNGGSECEQRMACLLASSALSLCNKSPEKSRYTIKVEDLAFLLSLSVPKLSLSYGVDDLHKRGYVQVARLPFVEATLRTNSSSGLPWELECSACHINLSTCHDTTAGLLLLLTQLQQLFAPNIEDSIVHLQSRWNSVRRAKDGFDGTDNLAIIENDSVSFSPSYCGMSLSRDTMEVGLMNDILEDAFDLHRDVNSSNSSQIHRHISDDMGMPVDDYDMRTTRSGSIGSLMPELIEGYYISDLIPLRPLSRKACSLNGESNCKSKNAIHLAVESGKTGQWYEDCSLKIVENHVADLSGNSRNLEEFNSSFSSDMMEPCTLRGRLVLKDIDFRWKMYAGSDWAHSRKKHANTIGRDPSSCLELVLSGMNIYYDIFPERDTYLSKLLVSVQEFHLYDWSRDAPWKTVLGDYHSRDHPRDSFVKAFRLELESVRPDPVVPLEEYRLHLAFCPIWLHLDQSQLDFLISFFTSKSDQFVNPPSDLGGLRTSQMMNCVVGGQTIAEEALLPFFQKFDIWPTVVRVDYSPRHINLAALRGGNYAELLNLVPWKGIELQLKHVQAVGVYGWNSVCELILGEWLEDISHNQVHKLLKGLAPIRSLFAVGSGTAKLVSLPVKSYRKENRLLKGMQRGAIAFVRSISLEAIGLGVHLAAGAHDILLQTECILMNGPVSAKLSMRSREKRSVRVNQPKDAQEGIQQAYESLSEGIGKTASALVGNPIKTYQRGGGAGQALATAVRAVPAAAVAPATAAARAVRCTFLGVRNSLDPGLRKESMAKYSGPTQSLDRRKWSLDEKN